MKTRAALGYTAHLMHLRTVSDGKYLNFVSLQAIDLILGSLVPAKAYTCYYIRLAISCNVGIRQTKWNLSFWRKR